MVVIRAVGVGGKGARAALLSASSPSSQVTNLARRRMSVRAESLSPEPEDSSKPLKVAALCGSLRRASYNRGLIRSAIAICKESIPGMHIEYIDIEPLPFLNTDLEVDKKFPPVVESFRKKIQEADSVLFASPEYNYSVTGMLDSGFQLGAPLKNAIDWASRPPNVWADKPAAIVSAGGGLGGARSQYHLRQIGVFLDLHFINKPELHIRAFEPPRKFGDDGNLIDEGEREKLKKVLLSLQAFSLRLKA
ncbi:NADPHquinone oxidoreductase [Nymphaea thermarum]|nr:NADPHquinone oxidoreductase [Nymphaea thermarum]